MIRLRKITPRPAEDQLEFLWQLQRERPASSRISSTPELQWEDHVRFVRNHPYREWFLVLLGDEMIGSIYAGYDNSIGVAILRYYQGCGYGEAAVRELMRKLVPLPAIPSVRRESWVANVAPENEGAQRFFERLGFNHIQVTYASPGSGSTSG